MAEISASRLKESRPSCGTPRPPISPPNPAPAALPAEPQEGLAADQHPDHDTIATFRQEHLANLAQLFVQVLQLCQRAGLVKLGHVVLDGTKVKANASKHKAMSYERMGEAEKKLEEEVKALLAEAGRVDAEEDGKYGKGKRGDELPEELARRERQEEERGRKFGGRPPQAADPEQAKPEPKAQRNFTDPDSRIMKDGATKEFVQGYNAQAAVDIPRSGTR